MMGMIAHHTGNLLEFDSSAPHFARRGRIASNDSSSSCDIPEMIMSASLKSFAESDDGDSLNESLSSSGRSQSPGMSPRSIFHSYWSSPNKALNDKNKDFDDDDVCTDDNVLERLRTLKLPLSDDGRSDAGGDSHARAAVVVVRPTSSYDDLVECQSSARSRCGPSTRRQILPPPPPPPAGSPLRMILPPEDRCHHHDYDHRPISRRNSLTRRPWSSTTALTGGGRGGLRATPSQSCLRKSRYSFSAPSSSCDRDLMAAAELAVSSAPARLHPGLRNRGQVDLRASATSSSSDMSRSVSFYSEVSVVEFAVPQEQQRSQEGWSRYFA